MKNASLVVVFVFFSGCTTLYQSGFPASDPKRCEQVSEDKALNERALEMKTLYKDKNYTALLKLSQEIIEQYGTSAAELQHALTEYPWESKAHVFRYGELNLVALAYFWQTTVQLKLKNRENAQESSDKLLKGFFYGQCFTDQDFFVKPAESKSIEHHSHINDQTVNRSCFSPLNP